MNLKVALENIIRGSYRSLYKEWKNARVKLVINKDKEADKSKREGLDRKKLLKVM